MSGVEWYEAKAALERVEVALQNHADCWPDDPCSELADDIRAAIEGRVDGGAEAEARMAAVRDVLARWNNCPGCFSPDHPCGDPKCDLWSEFRDAAVPDLAQPPARAATATPTQPDDDEEQR